MNTADMFAGSTHVHGNMTSTIRGGLDVGFSVEGKTFVICVNTQIMSGLWSWLPFCVRYIYIFSWILTAQHNGLKKRGWLCVVSVCVVQPTALSCCEAPAVTVADVSIQDDHSTRRRVKERANGLYCFIWQQIWFSLSV